MSKQKSQRGRPGAMTMAMKAVANRSEGPKVLRIALIQANRVVEERIIRKRETVTVGTSEKNHFTLAAKGDKGLSGRFELFQLVGDDYLLNFTSEMNGRVGLAGGVEQLAALRDKGRARKSGKNFQVKLTDNSRGKVEVGDITLLFQFVNPPPVQPKPQLPASVVGGFASNVDWLFTAIVMFSFMAHFGFVIYLEQADWPVGPSIAEVDPRVAELIFAPPEEPPEPPEEEPTEEEPDDDATEEPEETTPRETQAQPQDRPAQTEQARARANSEARLAVSDALSQARTMLLTSEGDGGGLFADVLADGMATLDSAAVLAQTDGTAAADGSTSTLRERAGTSGNTAGGGLGALTASNSGRSTETRQTTQATERRVRGRVNVGSMEDETGAGVFDSSVVVRLIRRRQRAIQRCYERELRNNPTLAGRVLVEFTIRETGSVSGARATENTSGSSSLGSCVVSTVRRLRFNPGPEGGSVTYSYPFVFAPQN